MIKSIPPGALALAILAAWPATDVQAEVWRFGVIGDTQWTLAATPINVNTVAVKQIQLVNQQFIAAGVDFVMQPGDLTDTASVASMATRLQANAALDAAGIPFYGVRGNHDNNTAAINYFAQYYVPAGQPGVTVAADGRTYAVNHKNLHLVMLDYSVTGNQANLSAATTWTGNVLQQGGQQHAITVSHKNLLGQNHKDNLFGGSNDANPALQNAFISTLQDNGVRYYLSGHDHVHHRSMVASPDGNSSVQQIISQSNSSKWYTPRTPYSPRETPIAQQLHKIGYTIYTVDGPRLSAQYYSTTPVGNDIADTPVWTLEETWGYSLNGTSRLVAQGGSYALNHRIEAGSHFDEHGFTGTDLQILDGTNGSTTTVHGGRATSKDVNLGWSAQADAGAGVISDVAHFWGLAAGLDGEADVYALSLSFDGTAFSAEDLAAGQVFLAGRDASGAWVNAVELNDGGTASFVLGAYQPGYGLGTYGIDPGSLTAWAVVNHADVFAVAAVPEPQTWLMLGSGLGLLGWLARRRAGGPQPA